MGKVSSERCTKQGTQTLLKPYFTLAEKRSMNAKNCQKMSQTNMDARKKGLSCWVFFLCSKVLYHPGLLTCNASSQAFMVQEITRGYIDGNRTILSRVNIDIFFIHVSKTGGLFKRKINTKIN